MTRTRMAIAGAAALVIGAAAVFALWPAGRGELRRIERQNVLLVTIDTLRADAVGAYGGRAATPALDRLAADGVRFDFAHAHAVLTLPSHASILTGQYPYQHGLRDNSGYRLPAEAATVATRMKQAGYATSAFVSAFPLDARFGLSTGFDVYDDRVGTASQPSDVTMTERAASVTVPLARQWIGRATAPWFSWVHVFDPHAPYRAPAPYDAQYAGRPYDAEVAATDAALAPLFDELRRAATPTLVIVTSDHGEGLGDHGETAHGIFAYESTLRVPLIVAQLGGASAAPLGEVSPVAARHVDILPTILDAVGLPLPTDLPGRTLWPAAERAATAPARLTYFEALSGMLNHGWAPLTGVLVGRDKFIELPIVERYDLAADAGELTNLAGRAPERDRALAATLSGLNAPAPGPRSAESAEANARLRALGYLSGQAPTKARYTDADDPKRLVQIDQALHRAVDAMTSGRVIEAEDLYKQVIDQRPDMAIPYRHIALIEWQAGNAATAVAVLRRAITQGATDARLLTQLGEYLTDMGQVAEGIRLLEPLAGVPTADADTLTVLGIAYARAGRASDAQRTFERLRVLLPTSSGPLENLGVLALERGKADEAKQFFARALALSPASSRALGGAGVAAMQLGDRPAAIAAWTQAITLDASNVDALFNLGLALAADGRASEARRYLEQFQRTAPATGFDAQRREAARVLQQLR